MALATGTAMSAVDTAQTGPPMTTRGRGLQKRAEHILHFTEQMLFPTGITNVWYGRRAQALLQLWLNPTRLPHTQRGSCL